MHGERSALERHRLRVEVRRAEGDFAIVALQGEADLHTAPILRDGLEEAIESDDKVVVVDLSGVSFVDSMMLSVLLGASRRAHQRGTEVRIVVDDPHVRRIFELTLLDRILPLYVDLAAALEGGESSGA